MATSRQRPPHPDRMPEPVSEYAAKDEAGLRRQEMADRLDALGRTLTEERSEAIQSRTVSGIETDWEEDESHYDGFDDGNRDEQSNAWRSRPAGQAVTRRKGKQQSAIFLNITKPAVNIAAARVCNILQARVNMKPTPVPELIGLSKGDLSKPQLEQAHQQAGGVPQQAAAIAEAAVRQAMQVVKEAEDKAKKAQKQVEDWFVEGKYYAANRIAIKDAAKIGTGVLKGPVPEIVRRTAMKDDNLIIEESIKPVTKRVDVWNCYPDWPSCGEDIHAGSYHWEKDTVSKKKLRELKGSDYLDDQIDLVLSEGPTRAVAPNRAKIMTVPGKGPYEIWYRYGDLTKENMEAAGCECEEGESIPALLTMVNEHVIKVVLNPLDSGKFPYDYFAWPQKRKGMPWGVGIARAGRTPQRIVAGAVRAMMDNAGRASGPQVIRGTQVQANDGVNEIVPWKFWDYAEDGDIDDVKKAFAFVGVPMMQQELANIIQMGIKWMEESTNMPMLLQGQQGSAPDLVGVVQILNANASEFLRDLGSSYDDDVSEPHGGRYYDYLLQYGPDECKGEFVLDTRGASVNVERLLQDQELLKAMQMSLNPVFKKDPAKFMDEYLVSRHFAPERFDYDDQEWQQIVANMKKGDPRTSIAQMRAQVELKLAQMEQAFEAQENDKERNNKIAVAMIDQQIASAELGSVERQVLEKLKVSLAQTAIKGNLQRELSQADIAHAKDVEVAGHAVDLHKHRNPPPQVLTPAVEPRGRARPGKAFQQ